MSSFAIETASLVKTYRQRFRGREIQAVSNLSLQVPEGVKFGLLGANGAGKTTFVKLLLSAVRITSGSARLFGRDACDPEARRPVGYLPENHRFPTYFTGAGMLDFYAALSGMSAQDRKRRTTELLDLVGLGDWGGVRIKKYSKGMLQRLGLAQALMHQPRLLLLDEPTDGVDPVGRRDIREILNRLTGSGVTVFLNSHLLGEVESFCEYVAILKRGRLVLEGKISSLTEDGGYQIVASEIPEQALRAFGKKSNYSNHGAGEVEIRVSSREEANRVIDEIRAAGGFIESIAKTASSLEELFIRTTEAGKAA